MEFKNEELVEREIEIAGYLLLDFSLNQIAVKTGLNKKILAAHLRNMMEKLNAGDIDGLIKLVTDREQKKPVENSIINQILKNKIMKQNRQFLLVISLIVFLTGMFVFYFSINFFKGFYENVGHFEYLNTGQVQ